MSKREELKKGYQIRANRNIKLAEEWRLMEEEVWRKYVKPVDEAEHSDYEGLPIFEKSNNCFNGHCSN